MCAPDREPGRPWLSNSGTGVRGEATGGNGLEGISTSSYGVAGVSTSGAGVFGLTQSGTQPGVYGQAAGGTPGIGVEGYAGAGARPLPRTNVGVVGIADGTGTGGYFGSSSGTGEALHVAGRAVFQRSGVASVPANRSYVDVTVPGGLSASAGIVATLQRRRGTCAVAAVRRNYPSAGKARIYLTKVASTSAPTDVAWFVFG